MVRIAGCLKTEACLESELGTSVGDYYIFILYKIWVQCQHVSDLLNLFNGYIIEETLFEIFLLKKKIRFYCRLWMKNKRAKLCISSKYDVQCAFTTSIAAVYLILFILLAAQYGRRAKHNG